MGTGPNLRRLVLTGEYVQLDAGGVLGGEVVSGTRKAKRPLCNYKTQHQHDLWLGGYHSQKQNKDKLALPPS